MNLTPGRARWMAAAALALPILGMSLRFIGGARDIYGYDFESYYRPHAVFVREALRRDGELPRWNPHQYAGVPLLGNSQGNFHYPGNWGFLVLPAESAFELLLVIHLLLAAFGMYRLARFFERSRPASVLAGIAYSLSFPFILRIDAGHVPHLITQAQAPWLLLLVLKTADRPTILHAMGLAGITSFVLLGGNPQLVLHLAVFAAALAAWRLLGSRPEPASRGRAAVAVAVGAFLGAALAAEALLPSLEVASASVRGQTDPALLSRLMEDSHDFNPLHLTSFWVPFFGWTRGAEAWLAHEKGLYFGILPFFLALATLGTGRPRGPVLFFAVGAALPLLAALVPSPLSALPGASLFRVPERVVWLTVLSLSVLSAFGWDLLSRPSEHHRRMLLRVGGLTVVVAILILVLHRAPEAFLLLGGAGAALGILWIAPRAKYAALAAIGWTVLDLAAYGQWRLRTIPREQYHAAPWYARHIGPERSDYRLLDLVHEPDAKAVAHGFRLLRGCGHPMPPRVAEYYGSAWAEASPRMDTLPNVQGPADPAILRRLNVRWIVTGDAEGSPVPGWRPVAREGSQTLFEDPAPGPGAFLESAEGSVTLTRPSANSMVVAVHASKDCRLVVSENWAPGWRAEVDRTPVAVRPGTGDLLQVDVPAGDRRVEFIYAPRAWQIGWGISIPAHVLLLAGAGWGLLRRRKRQEALPTVR